MGEYAEYSLQYNTEDDEYVECNLKHISNRYAWHSKAGIIDVRDMTDSHINNSIKLMIRKFKPLIIEKLKRIFKIKTKDTI